MPSTRSIGATLNWLMLLGSKRAVGAARSRRRTGPVEGLITNKHRISLSNEIQWENRFGVTLSMGRRRRDITLPDGNDPTLLLELCPPPFAVRSWR